MLRRSGIGCIYVHRVAAVKQTLRQLYEVLEADDDRVHHLVASATAMLLIKIDELITRSAQLEDELLGRKKNQKFASEERAASWRASGTSRRHLRVRRRAGSMSSSARRKHVISTAHR